MTGIEEIQETRVGTFCCKIEKRCMGGVESWKSRKEDVEKI